MGRSKSFCHQTSFASHLNYLFVGVGMHRGNEGRTCHWTILWKEASRSKTNTTCIAKGLWPHWALPPLRCLCDLTMHAFSCWSRPLWWMIPCLRGTWEHCQVLFLPHFSFWWVWYCLSQICFWTRFKRSWRMGYFRTRGINRNHELPVEVWLAWARSLASSTLHSIGNFGFKGYGIFNRARAAAFENRNWTGGLEEPQTFAIRRFVKKNASIGCGFSSDWQHF